MNIFFDTTVLVAASEQSHPHYARALPAVQRVVAKHDLGYISAHSIAETYAALTRLPVQPRIHPSEAWRIITENMLPHFEVVTLGKTEYLRALEVMKQGGWSGAKIYDALLLAGASKCKAERIYTFNMGDFLALASDAERGKVSAP